MLHIAVIFVAQIKDILQYIFWTPLSVAHRFAITEMIPLEVIEVQLGCYLGMHDIIHSEDAHIRG